MPVIKHCKRGHVLTEKSTYVVTSGEGRKSRACKACRNARDRLAYRKKVLGK